MNFGVTGTRFGMNNIQNTNVVDFLKKHYVPNVRLHEGDCVGVDAQVARIAFGFNYYIIAHPPLDDSLRAFYHAHEFNDTYNHLRRNRNIVDACDHLMVVPFQNEHQSSGGTWYTYDYAIKKKKPITIFYPDGRVKEYNNGILDI